MGMDTERTRHVTDRMGGFWKTVCPQGRETACIFASVGYQVIIIAIYWIPLTPLPRPITSSGAPSTSSKNVAPPEMLEQQLFLSQYEPTCWFWQRKPLPPSPRLVDPGLHDKRLWCSDKFTTFSARRKNLLSYFLGTMTDRVPIIETYQMDCQIFIPSTTLCTLWFAPSILVDSSRALLSSAAICVTYSHLNRDARGKGFQRKPWIPAVSLNTKIGGCSRRHHEAAESGLSPVRHTSQQAAGRMWERAWLQTLNRNIPELLIQPANWILTGTSHSTLDKGVQSRARNRPGLIPTLASPGITNTFAVVSVTQLLVKSLDITSTVNMKFTAAIIAFAGLAAAQSLADVPTCAQKCLADAVTSNGKCTVGDISCLCSGANYQAIVAAGTPCVLASCGADVAVNQVLPAASKICAAVAGGGGPASAASSVVASASAAASSVVASASAAVSSIASAATSKAASAASSVASSASRAVTSAASSAAAGTTRTAVVTSATTTRNGTSTATATATPVTVNGAATQGPVGLLAALALGALAYL
ncbi:CFEM domain-containing protein [Colletotrichum lupini]|uniref:CFEM domain-containing protein n=1 Tax=Colletotrichum lupini TaxID=145971 RepID=A0A9Q8SLN5_9PEZI|nr:CFEM domain-containing protein [Colletotrichum lupini]UQC79651.1 CFEM domain-containing protein [Colletotrichum lupini]